MRPRHVYTRIVFRDKQNAYLKNVRNKQVTTFFLKTNSLTTLDIYKQKRSNSIYHYKFYITCVSKLRILKSRVQTRKSMRPPLPPLKSGISECGVISSKLCRARQIFSTMNNKEAGASN